MSETLIKCLLAFALGNVMGGQLVGRLRGGVDLRRVGSGNLGATNALRTQGAGFAAAVLAIDIGKGVVAVTLVPRLPWPFDSSFVLPLTWLCYLCGIAAAVGHCYPPLLGFRGGKGVAVLAGVYGALMPGQFACMLAVFLLVLLATGYASVSTLSAAAVAVLFALGSPQQGLLSAPGALALVMFALVLHKHRLNLRRLWRGEEPRFEKLWVIGRWRRQ